MKGSIQSLCQFFNTHRMVGEYAERFYLPVFEHFLAFTSDGMQKAIDLASWKSKIRQNWHQVKVLDVLAQDCKDLKVGEGFDVKVKLQLGELKPEDVVVQLYMGQVSSGGEITQPQVVPLSLVERSSGEPYIYHANQVVCKLSGLFGFTVRILPHHPDLVTPFLPGIITWAST
jgi:starch phosphorylase